MSWKNPYIYTDNTELRYQLRLRESLTTSNLQQLIHFIMAKSLSELLLGFFALCPVRTAWIFLFLDSVFFSCFFIFFLAAMSGWTTACWDK